MCGSLCHDTALQRVSGLTVPWDAPPSCIKWCGLGCFKVAGIVLQRRETNFVCRPTLGVNYTQLAPDEKSCGSWRISVTPKASAGCKSTLAFGSSHEARRRRMAAFSIQLTRKPHRTSEPRGPSPSGGISQSIHMSPYAPARPRRSPGSRGSYPLREARRRAAVFRSQLTRLPSPCRPPAARSPGSRGTTPCARPVAERRYLRSQLTRLPSPCAPAARSPNGGTQSPILPRTMKRAPSKV